MAQPSTEDLGRFLLKVHVGERDPTSGQAESRSSPSLVISSKLEYLNLYSNLTDCLYSSLQIGSPPCPRETVPRPLEDA